MSVSLEQGIAMAIRDRLCRESGVRISDSLIGDLAVASTELVRDAMRAHRGPRVGFAAELDRRLPALAFGALLAVTEART